MSGAYFAGGRRQRRGRPSSRWRTKSRRLGVLDEAPEVGEPGVAAYVERVLRKELDVVEPDTPLFWSTWGRRAVGKTRAPMTGKNIWRLCKSTGGASATHS